MACDKCEGCYTCQQCYTCQDQQGVAGGRPPDPADIDEYLGMPLDISETLSDDGATKIFGYNEKEWEEKYGKTHSVLWWVKFWITFKWLKITWRHK